MSIGHSKGGRKKKKQPERGRNSLDLRKQKAGRNRVLGVLSLPPTNQNSHSPIGLI
jgi:hypothetical protein